MCVFQGLASLHIQYSSRHQLQGVEAESSLQPPGRVVVARAPARIDLMGGKSVHLSVINANLLLSTNSTRT